MRRAGLAALAIAVVFAASAPAASAGTYIVTGTGDAPAVCASPGPCPTLRAALAGADANSGPDSIVFSDALGRATISVTTTLSASSEVDIDGGGDITVEQSALATGPLFRFESAAQGARIRNITLAGPGAGSPGSTSLVSTAASDMTISASTLRDAATSGVSIGGAAQHVRVSQSSIYGYGTKAISFDAAGVNGGIAPPANLRVGPRRADGTLPVTGSTAVPGALELFRGPQQAFAFTGAVVGGDFSVVPSPEPAAGETVGATVTDAPGDTSEYATARVPDDVVSPRLVAAVATSNNTIEVQPSEPVDPPSVQPADFAVQMAGIDRPVLGASPNADGTRITLYFSDRWEAGEAGLMRLSAPGAISDRAGNVSLEPADVHVGGAPGDFVAPVVTGLKLKPSTGICWVIGPRCKRDRTAIVFHSSEDGDAFATIFRGTHRIGERRFSGQPGDNYVRFDGKVLGRRLAPGRYRMYMAMEDGAGNRTPFAQQPHATFTVKSTRGR
jgi:hypothetical protein